MKALMLLQSLLGATLLAVTAGGASAASGEFCAFSPETITHKSALRAQFPSPAYDRIVQQHAEQLKACRQRSWLKKQAIWIRLYACDLRPAVLNEVFDRIVDRGYNQVFIEILGDGRILLPSDRNPTPWPSVVNQPQTDLLRQSMAAARQRGLSPYAWFFSLNFGYSYGTRPDRMEALARNHRGQSTLQLGETNLQEMNSDALSIDQAFVDPYHPQGLADLQTALKAALSYQPDGVLFDYIRYKRGTGKNSIVSNVRDLWIYGSASRQVLLDRAENNQGRATIERYLSNGFISVNDIAEILRMFPTEREPLWQGRTPTLTQPQQKIDPIVIQPLLQQELWRLSISHAFSGVVQFLTALTSPLLQQGIPAGAVFFPEGNQPIGQGFDSRLQPWQSFPADIEWHPMVYAACGSASCIIQQLAQVVTLAIRQNTVLSPVLAGQWGKASANRPSLENQMQAIHQAYPTIDRISHFAFSWQEPTFSQQRKQCR